MGSTTLLTACILDRYLSYLENHGEVLLEGPMCITPHGSQAILDRGYGKSSHYMSIEEQRPMALGVMINIQWWQFMVGRPTRSVVDGIQQKPNGQSMRKG